MLVTIGFNAVNPSQACAQAVNTKVSGETVLASPGYVLEGSWDEVSVRGAAEDSPGSCKASRGWRLRQREMGRHAGLSLQIARCQPGSVARGGGGEHFAAERQLLKPSRWFRAVLLGEHE